MTTHEARTIRDGHYWGIVYSTKDPKKKNRIQCRVPDVLGKTISEWAEPDSMIISKLKPGDKVWVRFRHSDLRYPVYHIPFADDRGIIYNARDYLQVTHTQADALYGGQSSVVSLAGGKVHCQSGPSGGGYVPCVASAFEVASSSQVKWGFRELGFDPVRAVDDAPARIWRYRNGIADDRERVGPMLEDLPSVAHNGTHVDLTTMLGILWEAVRQLSGRLAELEKQREESV